MKTGDWFNRNWYYSAEIEPGVFTKGAEHDNIALTRKLLRNIDVRAKDCIDIGTQEGLVPILLKKAGAQRVVAYDRWDFSDKVFFLQERYSAPFEYVPGIQLRELPARLDREFGSRFSDLVVFSGVLYHMIDPFGLMALVRGLCKIGGLFLLETVARQQREELLVFNTKGAYGGPDDYVLPATNYFVPTTGWLDYALRIMELKPTYAIHLGSLDPAGYARIAVLCRSMPSPCPRDASDRWVRNHAHHKIFQDESQVDWGRLAQTSTDIAFHPYDDSVTRIDERGLFECLARRPAAAHKPERWELRLELKRGI